METNKTQVIDSLFIFTFFQLNITQNKFNNLTFNKMSYFRQKYKYYF